MGTFERQPQTVRLDGEKARTIREAKGLTQLYIAEVVGVTVDTVSRWENNRTATMRRDNIEALAKALEVDFSELLRREGGEEAQPAPAESAEPTPTREEAAPAKTAEAEPRPPAKRSNPAYFYLRLAFASTLAALGVWYAFTRPALSVHALRTLPSYMVPGTIAPVVVEVAAAGGDAEASAVVTEKIPPGWRLVGSAPAPDQGPDSYGVVKWILALKAGKARVTYVVEAPPGARESTKHLFSGEVVTSVEKGRTIATTGPTRLDLEYVHWADSDADFRIDDAEVLSALERTEAVKGFGLNPADLRALWGAGTYYWDKQAGRFEIKR